MAGYLGGTPFVAVVPAQQTLLGQLNTAFPQRSKASDGALGNAAHAATISFHNPNPQGLVQARDFTHDVAGGLDCNVLAAQLVASGDPRILEIIWNRRYWTPRGGWVAYLGTNPHDKHLHLSVVSTPALYNDTRPWALPMFMEDDLTPDQATLLSQIHTIVADAFWADRTRPPFGARGAVAAQLARIEDRLAKLEVGGASVATVKAAIAADLAD